MRVIKPKQKMWWVFLLLLTALALGWNWLKPPPKTPKPLPVVAIPLTKAVKVLEKTDKVLSQSLKKEASPNPPRLDLSLAPLTFDQIDKQAQTLEELRPSYIDWAFKPGLQAGDYDIQPSVEFYPLDEAGSIYKPWQRIKGFGLEFSISID